MFIISFFKILFFLILFILVYNIIRVMLFVKRNSAGRDGHINDGDRKKKTSRQAGKGNVIELDEDQYKVE